MGMSTSVVGFTQPNERWMAMKAVWDACMAAQVDIPAEVERFFDGIAPEDQGAEVPMRALLASGAVRDWAAEMQHGFEVEVAMLPPDIRLLRFFNSY
jgi:hypothetical protein